MEPAVIYSSDLCRAAETAGILAAGLDAPVTLDARLREYDIGVLSGVIWREVEVLHPELWRRLQQRDESSAIPGEEGLAVFHERLSSVAADILAAHQQDETVAVVCPRRQPGHDPGLPVARGSPPAASVPL